jgi:integrase
VSENTGRPCREACFQHTFAEIRTAAGLSDDLRYRDLRRTFATALGAAGCTDDEIRSLTGHKTRSVVAVYVRPDDRFAKGSTDKLEKAGNRS